MHRSVSLLLAILLLSGCWSRHKQHENAYTGPREVTIEWLGRGCFRVTSSLGLTILTDPFNPKLVGGSVKPGSVAADVVLVSHEDDTANYTDLAAGSPIIFRSSMAEGVNRASGVLVRGIRTSSENLAVSSRLNVAYTWAMDGIRFCHLGAIEDAVSPSEALNIGNVDILFIPVGGPPNFNDQKRKITIDRIRPKIVIPMSYSGSYAGLPVSSVVRINGNRFSITRAQLPALTTLYSLSLR
jgi:L-ascorbate metabolism protein UlaG (beta-lactamase superfamily)